MKLGTVLLPVDRDQTTARVTTPGLNWTRLGDTMLYWTADDELWDRAHERVRLTGLSLEERPAPGQAGDLRLVTQVGRVFQHEHPDVPVLVDKGRYLVVSIDERRLGQIPPRADVCYRVEPLPAGAVAFRTVTPDVRAPIPEIQALVDQVSKDDYREFLTELVDFGTRHSLSAGFPAVASRARDRLQGFGYLAELVPITVGSGQSFNVVANRLAAHRLPREIVVVTAHLDSINLAGGPAAPAPGADDNASGAAGLLEIARVLAGLDIRQDLRLILFGGEEQGLFGSRQYVSALRPEERVDIRMVINMDMIATLNTATPTVLLEGAEVSQVLIDDLAAAAGTYTTLSVQTSLNPFNSDHVPFIDALIPAVLTIEGADGANENVHTADDTLDRIDYGLALDIIRMNVATAAEAAL
ncbi:M28 family metallopeptidase [Streptosporangium sp. KLBMP 9127]|nr:M28 family metallopeptidase [Streptosporangium sp. KLBMP 9127]